MTPEVRQPNERCSREGTHADPVGVADPAPSEATHHAGSRVKGPLGLSHASPLSDSNRRPPLYKSGALAN